MFNVTSASLGVKRELLEKVVVPTAMYESETWGMRLKVSRHLDVIKNYPAL